MQNRDPPKKMFCPKVAEPIKARGRQTAGLRPCLSPYMFSNYHIHKNQLKLWHTEKEEDAQEKSAPSKNPDVNQDGNKL